MNRPFSVTNMFDRQALQMLQVPFALGLLLAWQQTPHHRTGDKTLFFITFLGFFWCLIYTVLVSRDRCSELELALPLSGVRIWKNHVFSSLVQTAAHVTVFLVPIALICELYIIRQYLATGGYVLPGLIFTGALVHRIEPGCNRVRNTGQLNGAVVAGLIVTVLLLVFRSPWFSLLTVVAAGLLLLAASRRVRESLTLVDDRPEPKGGYGSLGRWEPARDDRDRSTPVIPKGPARAGRRLSTLWMLGILNLRQYSLIADIFGFLILTSLGGALVTPGVGFGTVIVSLLSTLIILNVLSAEQNRSGSPYAHLPLPRRRLHAALLLPLLAAVGFGAAVQVGFLLAGDNYYPGLVQVGEWKNDAETSYFIHVPPRFRRIAWDGQPPVVVDSNGETHTTTMHLTKISYDDQDGPVIYHLQCGLVAPRRRQCPHLPVGAPDPGQKTATKRAGPGPCRPGPGPHCPLHRYEDLGGNDALVDLFRLGGDVPAGREDARADPLAGRGPGLSCWSLAAEPATVHPAAGAAGRGKAITLDVINTRR